MAKAREPKVFRSMDDLPLMLTPYDLMDFLGKGQRQTYELIHSEGFPYVQDGPKINVVSQTRQLSYEAAGRYVEKCNRELEEAQEELQAAWEAAGGVCPLCGSEVKENCTH